MAKLAQPEMKVVIIGGGGKSGLLACAQAARSVGPDGRVLALCYPAGTEIAAAQTGAESIVLDCTDAPAVAAAVSDAFMGDEADLVFVCTNVPGCEGGAILACSDEGRIVFFSMATSFTAAALLAEGMGRSCEMTIGNGYVPGHAEFALNLVRSDDRLLESFKS
jgi:L-erythro-3,5-diaminohexanoate dehydrogenase